MIRVLFVSRFFVSPHHRRFVRRLKQSGLVADIHIVVPTQWRQPGWVETTRLESHEADVTAIKCAFSGNGSLYLYDPMAMGRVLAAWRPDIVDVDEEPWSLAAWQCVRLAGRKSPSAQIVFETSQNILKRYPQPFRAIQRRTFERCKAAIAVSNSVQEVLRAQGYTGAIAVIGHPVDCDALSPGVTTGASFVIGYVGVVSKRKGVFVLLDAYERMACDGTELLVVGTGDGMREAKSRVALSSRLAGRVRFVGTVCADDVRDYLARMSVLVLPSLTTPRWKEQFGRVLIEAMAAGVPVVGSSSGGIPETVGAAGLITEEGDVQALYKALKQLKGNEGIRNDMARRGRARAVGAFSFDAVSSARAEFYRDTVANAGVSCG